jgi:hypothetical protein
LQAKSLYDIFAQVLPREELNIFTDMGANAANINLDLSEECKNKSVSLGFQDIHRRARLNLDIILRTTGISKYHRESLWLFISHVFIENGIKEGNIRNYMVNFDSLTIIEKIHIIQAYYIYRGAADDVKSSDISRIIGSARISGIYMLDKYLKYREQRGLVVKFEDNNPDSPHTIIRPTYPANYPNQTFGLKYYGTLPNENTKKWINTNLPANKAIYCAELGRARFDTKFVRNISWLVNIQLLLRNIMSAHLAWIDTPVVNKVAVLQQKLTEYQNNDEYSDHDYDGFNYRLV